MNNNYFKNSPLGRIKENIKIFLPVPEEQDNEEFRLYLFTVFTL